MYRTDLQPTRPLQETLFTGGDRNPPEVLFRHRGYQGTHSRATDRVRNGICVSKTETLRHSPRFHLRPGVRQTRRLIPSPPALFVVCSAPNLPRVLFAFGIPPRPCLVCRSPRLYPLDLCRWSLFFVYCVRIESGQRLPRAASIRWFNSRGYSREPSPSSLFVGCSGRKRRGMFIPSALDADIVLTIKPNLNPSHRA